ncbi:MAG: deoxyuridine 5'-triphosphate nucleotidohydrolase [Lachnospiraceae bacterium]|nr:deoxyuridine 5'-triphosphate nucleotidohydrolase [Lachnospiraceae bacterium]
MKRIAKFHKVSEEQFINDWRDSFGEEIETEEIHKIYESIKLPRRATAGSAGYDFFLTLPVKLEPGQAVKVPTGIRAEMCDEWVLQIYPRSGLGFKYRLQMNNTVGIIDSDYFYSDNEGHIFIKMLNDGREGKTVELAAGCAFAQGIFMEYGITEDDDVTDSRNGGFGSTDRA